MVDRSVAESWGTITGWLAKNLPSAIEYLQPPVSWSAISALRAGMGRRLPSDLVAWLTLNNGFKHRGPFGHLIPTLHTPLPCEKMLPQRQMMRDVQAGLYSDHPLPDEQQPAGTPSVAWLDGFLPISDTGTDLDLVVDLRDGELNGCVGEFDNESGGFGAPYWMSIADMLADVADALTLGRAAQQAYARRMHATSPWTKAKAVEPYLIDGEELHWSFVDLQS